MCKKRKMRKMLPMLLILAFLVSGCRNSESTVKDMNTGKEASDSVNLSKTEASDSANPSGNETTDNLDLSKEESHDSLNLSEEDIIEYLDKRLNDNGYTTLKSGFQSTITREVNGESYQCKLFIPSSGLYFYFLTKESTGELYQVTYKTVQDEISVPAAVMQGYIANTLPYVFEPDAWEELTEQLSINGADDVPEVVVEKGNRAYHYSKNEATSILNVIPTDKEVIDVEQLDFENGEIMTQEIDWTVDSFVEKLNSYFEKQSLPLLTKAVPIAEDELADLPDDVAEGVYYSLGNGVRLYLYASDSGRLERTEYVVLMDKVTDRV